MVGSSCGVAYWCIVLVNSIKDVVPFFQRELDFKLSRSFTCAAVVDAGLTTKSTHAR
jgi:hypothetical protein